jgi:integrase
MQSNQVARTEAAAQGKGDLGNPHSTAIGPADSRPRTVQSRDRRKLRGCDLVALKVHDIAPSGTIALRAIVMQRKTQRPVQFEITDLTREAFAAWIAAAGLRPDQSLFPSRIASSPHISTRQYARIVRRWVASIGLEPSTYGTHTMRKTNATLIYRRTRNIRAVQLLLGHTKLESTVRYLGIEVDDALEISEQTEA